VDEIVWPSLLRGLRKRRLDVRKYIRYEVGSCDGSARRSGLSGRGTFIE
jgi:hypothetical protein